MINELEKTIERLRMNAERYQKSERYYRGDHDLAFATAKFENAFGAQFREFALNLCPAVCDAVRDKLRISGFSVDAAGGSSPESVADAVKHIWHRSHMPVRSGELHKEALKNGDAYAIVWPDNEGRAAIFPNRAANCTVLYDEEMPGIVQSAGKFWRTPDKHTRINLYFPDRIERYISTKPGDGPLPDAGSFVPFDEGNGPIRNPFGVVPVFHFGNNADIGTFGRSELESAIPIQDGMNKSVLDMLVAMEYCAYRQRWAAGIEIEYDTDGAVVPPFAAGVDHLWVSEDANARFGEFTEANLEQFLKVKEGFRIDIASVTGTPLHYLQPQAKAMASGEALKRAETRFIAKVRDRQAAFGRVWEEVMTFALRCEKGIAKTVLRAQWQDPSPMSEREMLENILLKREIGISVEQALAEAGYGASTAGLMTE